MSDIVCGPWKASTSDILAMMQRHLCAEMGGPPVSTTAAGPAAEVAEPAAECEHCGGSDSDPHNPLLVVEDPSDEHEQEVVHLRCAQAENSGYGFCHWCNRASGPVVHRVEDLKVYDDGESECEMHKGELTPECAADTESLAEYWRNHA